MRGTVMAVALALGMVAACTQVNDIEPVGAVPLVTAGSPAQERTLVLQTPEPGEPGITLLRGADCKLGSQRATRSSQFAIAGSEYANVFQDELRRAGYRTADAVDAGAFAGKTIAADVRLVAGVQRVRANICLPDVDSGNVYDGKGEASMTVEWRIYAITDRRLLYRTTQRGYAKADAPIPAVVRELLRTAFARAIHGLLADDGFRAAMRGS